MFFPVHIKYNHFILTRWQRKNIFLETWLFAFDELVENIAAALIFQNPAFLLPLTNVLSIFDKRHTNAHSFVVPVYFFLNKTGIFAQALNMLETLCLNYNPFWTCRTFFK